MKNLAQESYPEIHRSILPIKTQSHEKEEKSKQAKETAIIHEAEIITPKPYGVFALCKILEHFQIN